jgi:hypothetical protein
MASLVQQVASDQTTNPTQGVQQSLNQGLDAGLAFAAAKQKQQLMKDQLDAQKLELERKYEDQELDALQKASQSKDKRVTQLMLDTVSKRREARGLPGLNPDTMKLMGTDEGKQALTYIVENYPKFRTDPKQYAEAKDYYNMTMGGDPGDASNGFTQMAEFFQKNENQQQLDQYRDASLAAIAANAGNKANQQANNNIEGLRKETTSGKKGEIYDRYIVAKTVSDNLSDFSKDPNAYADSATILQAAKVLQLDSSVVREPEMKAIQAAGGLENYLKNSFDQAVGNGGLQPEQRRVLQATIDKMKVNNEKAFIRANQSLISQAKTQGLPLDQIFNREEFPSIFEAQAEKRKTGLTPASGKEESGGTDLSPNMLSQFKKLKDMKVPYDKISPSIRFSISKDEYEGIK